MGYDFSSFLDRLAAFFEAGDLQSLAAHCVMPLPVYLGGSLMVLGSRDVAAEALGHLRAMVTAQNMAQVRATIDAVELPVSQQQSLYATWTYTDTNGAVIGRSKVRYVLGLRPFEACPQVHLVHYIQTDFTDLANQMPFSAHGSENQEH